MTWPQIPLGELAQIDRLGISPEDIRSGTSYVGLENIAEGGDLINVQPVSNGDLASTKFAFTQKHVLYGKLRPYLRKIARPGFEGICSTDILPILPGKTIDRDYLAHSLLLDSSVSFAVTRSVGVNLPRISPSVLETLRIPLPPMEEQRRIAAILDQAEALRAKRRQALAKLDTLTQSLFLEMFGDLADNPQSWPIRTIAELFEVKGGKRLPKGEEYSVAETPFRYLRVMDFMSGEIDPSKLVFLKPEVQRKIARYTVAANDVVISIAGTIGRTAAIGAELAGVNLTENAAKLVPRKADEVDAVFLAEALRMPFLQDQISARTGQVTIGKLALFRIEQLSLPLPPHQEQEAFAKAIRQLKTEKVKASGAEKSLGNLCSSLQHRAFQGEL